MSVSSACVAQHGFQNVPQIVRRGPTTKKERGGGRVTIDAADLIQIDAEDGDVSDGGAARVLALAGLKDVR